MKIIFESEEEFNDFINYGCPSYILGLNDHKYCEDGVHKVSCKDCWKQSGLEYKIKKEESIEMTNLKDFYTLPFVDLVYETVRFETLGLDSIYKDYIINLVGITGLNALIEHKLVEGCGIVNGRKLYVLCDRERKEAISETKTK